MQLTEKSRRVARGTRALTVALVVASLGLAAWLSTRHALEFDWTRAGRNTLSQASTEVLSTLRKPLAIEVFARPDGARGRILGELLRRFQGQGADLSVTFVNPDLEPQRLRDAGINRAGAVVLRYDTRQRIVERPSERSLTNAILQLSRARTPIVAFLEDHGERNLTGRANHDLGTLGRQLEAKGFQLQPLSLARAGGVPDNTAVLVVAGPRVALLGAEVRLLTDYLERGGNLLWLLDPDAEPSLNALAEYLSIEVVPGTLIDPASEQFTRMGMGDPTFVLVNRYAQHPALRGFNVLTIFPGAAGLATSGAGPSSAWRATSLLTTSADVWAERGRLAGTVGFDAESDRRGPFAIALALVRPAPEANQRVIVVSDGDFLSNAAIGNSGNLDLGLRLLTWLVEDDELVAIPARTDPDGTLELTPLQSGVIGLGALFGLPGTFILAAAWTWWRRRHR
ncbi:MAG: GldG family protein [Pseudomonadota bacterium]